MRIALATIAALITLAVPACALYADQDQASPDAAPAAIDARAEQCPFYWPACEPGALRLAECRALCTSAPTAVCPGSDAVACLQDCRAEIHMWTGYCP